MELNYRQSTVNKIYSALRDIDSYKYGLVAKEVLKLQLSMLVFLKENGTPADEGYKSSCDYKSYLLDGIWSQVRHYWDDSIPSSPSCRNIFNQLKALNPTHHDCLQVLEAISNNKRLEFTDATPTDELAELIIMLLEYKEGVVYNPNAGDGTFGRLLNIRDEFFGRTFSETQWSIGVAKMLLLDKLPSTNYILAHTRHLDICSYSRYINIFRSKEIESDDYEEMLSGLSPDGKAIIVMPAGQLSNPRIGALGIRRDIIKENLLDKVILLPPSLLVETGVTTAILVCKKGRKEGEPVTMLDANSENYYTKDGRSNKLEVLKVISDLEKKEIGNRVDVSLEVIAEERYNLNPCIYLKPEYIIPDGYTSSPLIDLAQPVRGISRRELNNDDIFITPSTLELNQTDFHIDINLINNNNGKFNGAAIMLTKSCLLIAPRNRHISAAYYEYKEGDRVFVDSLHQVMILDVNDSRIDPRYLVLQLRSAELNLGTSSVSRSYILNMPIVYPTLAEQRKIVEDTVKANKLTKIRELGLTEEIQRLKDEYKTVIRTKKHNLGTLRGKISANVRELLKQANRSSQSGEINIQVLLRRVNRLVDYWSDLDARLDKIADENIFRDPEEFEFDGYFRDLEAEKVDRNYGISYILDKGTFEEHSAKMAINVNPNDFKQVVENIISNAQKHGFRDLQRDDYYLNIRAYCDEDTNGVQRVCFLFENNGYPAPTMTKEQFGTAGWHSDVKGSKGEGLGGAYISEMTRNFGGGYEPPHSIADEIGEYSRTTILIYFPAIIRFNDNELALRQYALETICDNVEEYINYNGYDHNVGFEINFDPELEISAARLQDLGYDMNDDESTYFDESGRPFHSDSSTRHVHWIGDLSVLDETGKRVANEVYIRAIVEELLSGDKILFI